jgi:TRAP-type C4-dicarboxylate transport system permease small subunit
LRWRGNAGMSRQCLFASPRRTVFLKTLHRLAELLAILAGLLLTFITLMTCASLLGRHLLQTPLVGDFELTGLATGAAIALFMPYCQATGGHIIVDFFTARLGASAQSRLDRLGALGVALVFALLAWRTVLGGLNSYQTHSETQILGFPEWWAYAAMVPAFALTALIALGQMLFGLCAGSEPADPAEKPGTADATRMPA